MSPKTLPGAVTEPRNIPGSRRDRAIPVMTCIPAVPEPSGRDRCWGEGAQQHFPPHPQPRSPGCYFSCWSLRGADKHPAGAVCKSLLPSAPKSPPSPSSPARDSLAAHPQTSHLSSPHPPGQTPHTRILVACLRPDPSC